VSRGDLRATRARILRVLDALPPAQCARCASVYLGHNLLRSLRGIEQFSACATLSLAGNPLGSWAELRRLHALRRLRHLTLADTPLAAAPHYRARALVALCDGGGLALASLDGAPVGPGELAAARATLRAHRGVVEVSWARGGGGGGGGGLTLNVTLPTGSGGTVSVPKQGGAATAVSEGGAPVWAGGAFVPGVPGVTAGVEEPQWLTFTVASGAYVFQATSSS
jgi:hypothetical protein